MHISPRKITAYAVLWLLVSLSVFSIAVWFSNWKAIFWTFSLSEIELTDKLMFLLSFYGSIVTNFTVLSATSIILVSVLFGLTVSLFVYYVRMMRGVSDASAVGITGIGGLVSGFFGIGCASCGSILALTLLGQFGAGSLLLLLPFGGEEFSLIAILLLGYSAYSLIKKIRAPIVCDIA
jgi:hypothetical protein